MSGIIAGVAIAAIGIGLSSYEAVQSAQAQKASAQYQNQVAQSNQAIATQNANFSSASGEQQAAVQEQKTRAQIGSITAAQASSGVDINSTTDQDVRTSAGELGALDAQTIRSNAARQAYGYETQATNFENAGAADVSQGNNDLTAGYTNAGAGALNSAGSASMNYAKIMSNSTGINTTDSINTAGANATGSGGISGNG